MTLADQRQAIRLLLDERNPGDAMAAYYAFHHGDDRTALVVYPAEAGPGQAAGYAAISRTGMDLFRPLLTMRLPLEDLETCRRLLQDLLPSGGEAFLSCPQPYEPVVRAFFDVGSEERLILLALDPARYEPIVNVLVTREMAGSLPRFVIKQEADGRREAIAAAAINWQSPHFAEIGVRTQAGYRRRGYGRSVVAALAGEIIQHGRRPLYAVARDNAPSIDLAVSVGFVDTGYRQLMMEVRAR